MFGVFLGLAVCSCGIVQRVKVRISGDKRWLKIVVSSNDAMFKKEEGASCGNSQAEEETKEAGTNKMQTITSDSRWKRNRYHLPCMRHCFRLLLVGFLEHLLDVWISV